MADHNRVAGSSYYRCLTDSAQEGDGESDMSYFINLPSTFVEANKVKLETGLSSICIMGGAAIRTEFGKPDYIVIPTNAHIHFVASRATGGQRHLAQTSGTRSVLVVRVTAPNSPQSTSAISMTNSIFGIGGEQHSMASQYSSCSFGKIAFVPANGYSGIVNGVLDLVLPTSVVNINVETIENSMKIAVKNALNITNNLDSSFSNIMFCMPKGAMLTSDSTTLAYAYLNNPYTYYKHQWCSSTITTMHEIGHNLGLQHSTEAGDEYGDGSCMMGADYFSLAFPAICFNAQKNYLLGWYSDYQITVDPATNGAWSGKLVSFVDYPKASTLNDAYVLIVVGQLYIQYNLAESFNFQVFEQANKVTIVAATSSTSKSNLLGGFSAGQTFMSGLFSIDICGLVVENGLIPKHMIISIRLTTQKSTCPGAMAAPTKSPISTLPPTLVPTKKPSPLPTRRKPIKIPATKKPTTAKPTKKPF